MLELSDSINVWVFFRKTEVHPYIFFWKGRRIKIDSVNLMHTSKEGADLTYHFSVSAENNFYRLGFSIKTLKWVLEAVEEGD